MGTQIGYLRFSAKCPCCQKFHEVKVQTATTLKDLVGTRSFTVGDSFPIDEATFSYLTVVRARRSNEPLVVIEDGMRCGEVTLWTELTVADGAISALRLVEFDLEELSKIHLLPPRGTNFWSWTWEFLDPGTLESDLLTKDPVRKLFLKMLIRSVMPARTRAEVTLAIEHFGFTWDGELEAVAPHWIAHCAADAEPLDLRFTIDEPTNQQGLGTGRSQVLPPDAFFNRARNVINTIPDYPSDLLADTARLDEVTKRFGAAVMLMEQVRAFLDEGVDEVPLEAFWGDAPRALREENPRLYSRSWIEREIALHRRDADRAASPTIVRSRSPEESDAFMRLHPCPRCATPTPRLQSRLEVRGADLASVYAGGCPTCSLSRRFEFTVGDDLPVNTPDEMSFGSARSSILDPGQWILVADSLAKQVPADLTTLEEQERASAHYKLLMASSALDEVIKFIEGNEAFVREDKFFTRMGWRAYIVEPGRFQRRRLVAVWEAYHQLRAGISIY